MSDSITVTGIVATTPRHLVTSNGLAITSFRLASGQRRYDRAKQAWVDAETNWYTVSTFRQLAHNVVRSVRRGEHVVVAGRLRIRDWQNADKNGTAVEIEAESVGHNLTWCTTIYQRMQPASASPPNTGGGAVSEVEDATMAGARGFDDPEEDDTGTDGFLPREAPGLVTLDS